MSDIKQQIEEEAKKLDAYFYDDWMSNATIEEQIETIRQEQLNLYKEAIQIGYNMCLSKWQEATRWRKVSEEMPEDNSRVLVKSKAGRYYLSCYSKTNGFSSNANITHWQPINP